MKKKIGISLALLFILFGCGALITAVNISTTTALFSSLVKLQQIEGLRHHLIQKILVVHSDLYRVNTPQEQELGRIIENVQELDAAASGCMSCHHEPEVETELVQMHSMLQEFKAALSFYITASANRERIENLKESAVLAGNQLLGNTEKMSFGASSKVQNLTNMARAQVKRSTYLLIGVICASCVFGILIAFYLTRSVTSPISELVKATRKISAGELGYTLRHSFRAEFGELTNHFNSMSRSLQEGYDKLQREIVERREAEEALRQSEERYALAARGANDGLWDWDLEAGKIHFSSRWMAMLGIGENTIEPVPEEWFKLLHPDDRQRLEAKIAAHLEGRSSHLEDEHRIRHRNGSYRWMLVRGLAVRTPEGHPYRMAGSQTDVTERKLAEEQLVHDALHDSLTGLPNRTLFLDRLEHLLLITRRRQDYRFAVLFLDLDRFKFINDSLGHIIGDQVLVAVGQRLAQYLRPNDTVARLGGDEFAILLEDIQDSGDAVRIAERIHRELPSSLVIGGHEIFPTASIGIALSTQTYERPEELLRDADLAMYHAKANGKARYEIFDSFMYAHTIEHLQLENDLRRAIERNEFRLEFQPILATSPSRLTGFEALIRWDHPTRGPIPPGDFIGLAEETGLITRIGSWVLRQACRQIYIWQQRWPSDPPLALNLNLSGKEFTPTLVEQVEKVLAEYPLAPGSLRLEITEGTIMNRPDTTAGLLEGLKALGVGLHIDDFGTGYSSLNYLHHFPIDALKIDRSFIQGIHLNRENLEIVRTIVALAHGLGMHVVAEGVENQEELALVTQLGCELVQGFFLHRPLTNAQVEALLNAGQPPSRGEYSNQGVSG